MTTLERLLLNSELRTSRTGSLKLLAVEHRSSSMLRGLFAAMGGQLGPEIIETVVGRAEVREVFPAGKRDKAAGLLVLEGVMRKGLHARLTREDVIVSKTTISSLRRFKDDVSEVRAGMECGVLLADTNDIKAGDHLEVFEVEERARTL